MEKNKKISIILFSLVTFLFVATPVSAHVVVKPSEVGIGSYQTFSMSVPSEKAASTVSLRLVIPEGLTSVRPNVKPGWQIVIKKDSQTGVVNEIEWVKGSIPQDQRDEFVFSAKTPSGESSLKWKAYQTYSDNSVVSWDQESDVKIDDGTNAKGPYSVTKVIDDLDSNAAPTVTTKDDKKGETFATIALALSIVTFMLQVRGKKIN